MRISDWSSDVCSSDLAKGNSTVGLIYSLSPNGALPVIALTNFGNAAQFEGIISAFVAGAGGPPNAGAGAAAAYAAANPNLDPGGIASYLNRTEEHTSELQSLMRISYAVFCLKKKKNK